MRTTINVDEKLLADIVETTGQKTKSKAVQKALEEYLRRERLKGLLALQGSNIIDLDQEDLKRFRRASSHRGTGK